MPSAKRNRLTRWVQACIVSGGFPETIEGVLGMVEKNRDVLGWASDMDVLLEFEPEWDYLWSTPKWLTQGDLVFFYHTLSARTRIAKLLRQAPKGEVRSLLQRAAQHAEHYAGTIFGCGEADGSPIYLPDPDGLRHFKDHTFAYFSDVHIFDSPLPSDQFSSHVRISQGTVTPLGRKGFDGIKQQLSKDNALPDCLKDAQFSEAGFRDVTKDNWMAISCSDKARFILEVQVREYFIDYLLDRMRDKGTPVLEECRCLRRGTETGGIVDYFVQLGGLWVPVEAKLNLLAEQDLPRQLSRYVSLDAFAPTRGRQKDLTFRCGKSPVCLVVDEAGVFLTLDGEFVDCTPDEPVCGRIGLTQGRVHALREELLRVIRRTTG